MQFGELLSGAILVETVYNWPGMGRLAFNSILRRDTPTLLGILFFSAVLVTVANLLVDFCYQLIDPRMRLGDEAQRRCTDHQGGFRSAPVGRRKQSSPSATDPPPPASAEPGHYRWHERHRAASLRQGSVRPCCGPLYPAGVRMECRESVYLGRDVFAGILTGGRTTLAVCSVAALITVFIGVPIGALGGYYTAAGSIARALMRFTEFFQVLPSLLFAMVLVALFKPSLVTVTIAIGVVNWTSTARIARGEFLRLRHMDFVRALRACGATYGAICPARNSTQRFAAAHRLFDAFCGRCHPVRGRFELPRTCGRPKRDDLGRHDRLEPERHPNRVVGCYDTGDGDVSHRSEHYVGRRRVE